LRGNGDLFRELKTGLDSANKQARLAGNHHSTAHIVRFEDEPATPRGQATVFDGSTSHKISDVRFSDRVIGPSGVFQGRRTPER